MLDKIDPTARKATYCNHSDIDLPGAFTSNVSSDELHCLNATERSPTKLVSLPGIDVRDSWTEVSSTIRKHHASSSKNPASVAKRNARERRRIKNVNLAFDELRQHVPLGEQNRRKMSKVDTLQSAIEYIKALEKLVKRKRDSETQNAEKDGITCHSVLDGDMRGEQIAMANSSTLVKGISEEHSQITIATSAGVTSLSRTFCGSRKQQEVGTDVSSPSDLQSYESGAVSHFDLCTVSDEMDSYIGYTPLLGEVTPDEVDNIINNATAGLGESMASSCLSTTDKNNPHSQTATTIHLQTQPIMTRDWQGYSTDAPRLGFLQRKGDPVFLNTFSENINREFDVPLNRCKNGAEAKEYLDFNGGYKFGDTCI